ASLEPSGFAKLVRDIRHIELAMGGIKKQIQKSEAPVFKKLAKSVVSAVDISANTILSADMLTTKGPGNGISPARLDQLIGKSVCHDITADIVLKDEDINW
ncbi:MAG: SAF domain-containing protein, partial [Candidatus Marinimicrobia bacterium]|nr:SAF domain-containing protein [Candidatus Neomarinimicrobiota bacterium]